MDKTEQSIWDQMKELGRREAEAKGRDEALSALTKHEKEVAEKEDMLASREAANTKREADVKKREDAATTREDDIAARERQLQEDKARVDYRDGQLQRDRAELEYRKVLATLSDKANAAKKARWEAGFKVRRINLETAAREAATRHTERQATLQRQINELQTLERGQTTEQRLEEFMGRVETRGKLVTVQVDAASKKLYDMDNPLDKVSTAIQNLQTNLGMLTNSVGMAGQQVNTTVNAAQNVVSSALRKSTGAVEDLENSLGLLKKAIGDVGREMSSTTRRLGQDLRITTSDARESAVTHEHNNQAVTELASDLTRLSQQFREALNLAGKGKGKEREPTIVEEPTEDISDDSVEQFMPRDVRYVPILFNQL